jgi:hypothetical protein
VFNEGVDAALELIGTPTLPRHQRHLVHRAVGVVRNQVGATDRPRSI